MRLGTLRFYLASIAVAATAIAAVAACSSSDALSAFANPGDRDGGLSSDASPFADSGFGGSDAAAVMIPANGIVIVHAAEFGAFRLCLESAPSRQPIPSADLLPESNLLGVDVGSVVRIDPLEAAPKKIYAFAVDDIKTLYPPGKNGFTCGELLSSAFQFAHEVANLEDDLSSGVHLLVLRGSLADQDLRMEKITLNAFNRTPSTLPVQVLPLSRDLSARAGNRKIGITAGLVVDDADAGDGGSDAGRPEPFVEGALPFGVVAPKMPVTLMYDPDEEAAFATSGFIVTLGGSLDGGTADAGDAGAREVILAQSLAEIQRLSAPRALPAEWFNAASSYVLLLLGSAQEKDAAADDLTKLHFLAVPIAAAATGVSDATTD